MKIKICGLNPARDVQLCIDLKVDYLGFVFYKKSPRNIDISQIKTLSNYNKKDSAFVAHELKHKYGMHPLTVTWSPLKYTDIGWENLINFNDSGFDVVLGMPKGDVKKKLTKHALIEMGDPFQGFIYGQVLFPVTIALNYGIKLIFRGENAEAEYGGSKNSWDKNYLPIEDFKKIWFSVLILWFWVQS